MAINRYKLSIDFSLLASSLQCIFALCRLSMKCNTQSTAQHSNIFIRNWFTEAINWWTDTINTTLFNFYLTVLWDAMKWLKHARLTQHCAFLYSLDMVQTLWIYTLQQYVVRAHCTAQIFILLLMAPNVWHNCINNMNVLLWVLLKKIYTLFFQARFYSFRRFFCIFFCVYSSVNCLKS